MLITLLTLLATTAPAAVARCDCNNVVAAPVVDGKLDDAGWTDAAWTSDFVDIEGADRPAPPLQARAKIAFDATHLYVAAELSEPHVWAAGHARDGALYKADAFELFVDPDGDGHDYVEVQVAADNTVTDLRITKPYRDRGRADIDWNIAGLRSAVHVDGTINDATDRDVSWTIELAIPFKALGVSSPRDGDIWRVNMARVKHEVRVVDGRYEKVPGAKGKFATWSPHGAVDMHLPQRWGELRFVVSRP